MSMRQLFIRPDRDLRRRIRIAAANADLPLSHYCRNLVSRWCRENPRSRPNDYDKTRGRELRFPVTENVHRQVRIAAAAIDVSPAHLVICILNDRVPFEVELLALAMTQEAPLQDATDGP